VDDRLRPLWDFDDLDASERRFRDQLEAEESDDGRAEVLTQLARIEGLRGAFVRADALADEAEAGATSATARARLGLERGRIRRSSGDPEAALPLFVSAYEGAVGADRFYMAADAAHMAALAAPDHDGVVAWTNRGIELAETHEAASYWLGPLLNNLGWEYDGAGEHERALDAFERALTARERDPGNEGAVEIARYAVGRTLRVLGRAEEAVPLLEAAVAWTARTGNPDGWFHEELALEYAAVGRADEAREQAQLAIPLLEADDPSFADDDARRDRLTVL